MAIGSQREREKNQNNLEKAKNKKNELEHQVFRIRTHLSDIE